MAISNLTGQKTSKSFQNLLQISSSGALYNGTGSLVTNIIASSSYAATASYALNAGTTIDTGSLVTTSSFNVFTSSYNTGSFIGSFTGSLFGTSSYAVNALTASYLEGYVSPFPFTGSAGILGSLEVTQGITGSLFGTSSFAISASWAPSQTIDTSALVTTSSFNSFTSSYNTGSFTGSFIGTLAGTASFAYTASFLNSTTNAFIQNGNSFGATALLGTNDNQSLALETSGSTRMFISSSGNVGIGTDTPSAKLDVNGNVIVTGFLTVTQGITGSLFGTSSWALNSVSSSFAQSTTLAPNYLPLTGGVITGSLTITNNLTVIGSASIQYISESVLNIGTNLITVNTINPGVRFGGLAVIDSGSSPQVSASFLYDSQHDEFIFVHKGTSASAITSSHFVLGPETYNDLGNELYLTANRIPKGTGIEHLNDSNISDNGSVVSINSNTQITGSLKVTSGITAANGVNIKWSGDPDADDAQIFKYFDTFVIINKQNINPNTNNIVIGGGPSSIYNDVYIGKGNFYVTSGSANITGNAGITGTLNVTNGITGSLFGTSSWSNNAITASYILNAVSSSFATTASYVENAQTASYVLQAVSSSYAATASFALNTGGGGTSLGLVQAFSVGLQNIF